MRLKRARSGIVIASILSLIWAIPASSQSDLTYRDRGNRHEGIKDRLLGGTTDVELISMLADYAEETEQIPGYLRIKFYLERPSEKVSVTVRELRETYFYWMDKVQPSKSWPSGFNEFQWPTQDVIRPLNDRLGKLDVYDLGVIVRLKASEPTLAEELAPAVLYHSSPPSVIDGYLFTFETSRDAQLAFTVYRESQEDPVFRAILPKVWGGRPFTVRWVNPEAPEGLYRLVISGAFLTPLERVEQTLQFYHKRKVD